MLSLAINLRNPYSQQFKNLWSKMWGVNSHKYIELEVYRDSSLLSINFSWTIRQSHAGLDIELGLLGYCVHFNLYDNRHWNYTEGRWMRYSEELGEH
jgi:hypothetical protein